VLLAQKEEELQESFEEITLEKNGDENSKD